ncbi:MAG TPA: cupin domain-containing protein [Sphingomonadaceae bacterium]|nr:cupin domain-containing protein [Sphingomonadaceae bacterium]
MPNLFDALPDAAAAEIFTDLHASHGVRIERIVSWGQATPVATPFDQDHDEWVVLLAGEAGLSIEGEAECRLVPGGYVLIPAHRRHRVTWTAADRPTVWLAIHFPPAPLSKARGGE